MGRLVKSLLQECPKELTFLWHLPSGESETFPLYQSSCEAMRSEDESGRRNGTSGDSRSVSRLAALALSLEAAIVGPSFETSGEASFGGAGGGMLEAVTPRASLGTFPVIPRQPRLGVASKPRDGRTLVTQRLKR